MVIRSVRWVDVIPTRHQRCLMGRASSGRRDAGQIAADTAGLWARIEPLITQKPRTIAELMKATGAYETDVRLALKRPEVRSEEVSVRKVYWVEG